MAFRYALHIWIEFDLWLQSKDMTIFWSFSSNFWVFEELLTILSSLHWYHRYSFSTWRKLYLSLNFIDVWKGKITCLSITSNHLMLIFFSIGTHTVREGSTNKWMSFLTRYHFFVNLGVGKIRVEFGSREGGHTSLKTRCSRLGSWKYKRHGPRNQDRN